MYQSTVQWSVSWFSKARRAVIRSSGESNGLKQTGDKNKITTSARPFSSGSFSSGFLSSGIFSSGKNVKNVKKMLRSLSVSPSRHPQHLLIPNLIDLHPCLRRAAEHSLRAAILDCRTKLQLERLPRLARRHAISSFDIVVASTAV